MKENITGQLKIDKKQGLNLLYERNMMIAFMKVNYL